MPALTARTPLVSLRTSVSFWFILRHAPVISAGLKGTVIRLNINDLSLIPLTNDSSWLLVLSMSVRLPSRILEVPTLPLAGSGLPRAIAR